VGAGMAAGAGAAFGSTLVSMRLITMLERSRSLRPYALYRAGLAATALIALRQRRRAAARRAGHPAGAPPGVPKSDGGRPGPRAPDHVPVG
jgi:hypothetical protein